MDIVELAKDIASKAHKGQFRRDKKTPYFDHVEGVALSVVPSEPEYIATAYLHDVLEDSSFTSMDLTYLGIPDSVVQAVLLLTKFDHVSYEKYLEDIKPNPIAKAVKIADITYNLNDSPSPKQILKYTYALEYLNR